MSREYSSAAKGPVLHSACYAGLKPAGRVGVDEPKNGGGFHDQMVRSSLAGGHPDVRRLSRDQASSRGAGAGGCASPGNAASNRYQCAASLSALSLSLRLSSVLSALLLRAAL